MVDLFLRPLNIGLAFVGSLYSANAGASHFGLFVCTLCRDVALSRVVAVHSCCSARGKCTHRTTETSRHYNWTPGRAPDAIQKSKQLSSASFSAACVPRSASGRWPSFLMLEHYADILRVPSRTGKSTTATTYVRTYTTTTTTTTTTHHHHHHQYYYYYLSTTTTLLL